ncbi:MAG: ATP cone domain-containing protein [bacterium]|nr:ATP cone domain-containing protein [bacterium]
MQLFTSVKRRDGNIVPFNQSKISGAVWKAMEAVHEGAAADAERVSANVIAELLKRHEPDCILDIEEIQDTVERELISSDFAKAAKGYILYREERTRVRDARREIPESVQRLAEESKKYFRNALGEFIYYRSYSRWIEDEGRRETWIETVDRYMSFMRENLGTKLTDTEYADVREAILWQRAMPSMRLLWSAGKGARATNVSAYNCSFTAPTKPEDLGEIMYLSMCGAGVGFSVEQQTVQKLPQIKKQTGRRAPTHVIADSKEGWATALVLGLKTWFAGKDIDFDFSELRPQGARLMTMGGKSSGAAPLRIVLEFSRRKLLARQGKRLEPIDVHDIICKIGEVVVMGGVRRTALISLSDFDDEAMRHAKSGQFYLTEPQRALANNSAVYTEKPSASQFLDEWVALAGSGTGERGIFNRGGLKSQMPVRRWKKMNGSILTTGTNPCGEIVLRSKQFCNLTEVVARHEDTVETLLEKVRIAALLGTYQSTLTDFSFLSKEWKKNCEEERLLGVSITGQWDCPVVRDPAVLRELRDRAVAVNEEYAKRFGINCSTSVTCVKPSGTVSQLVDAASGLHPRHAPYYIRRIRIAASDGLFQMLRDQKVPCYPEVGQHVDAATTYVFEFPVKAPDGSVLRNDMTALEQLEHWRMVKENFTEHNPSVTISVGDGEWIEVANWLYRHWDMIGGLSFLPRADHVYTLAPYEEITKERYEELVANMPSIDFSQILRYEREDMTQGAKELACVGGTCEIHA